MGENQKKGQIIPKALSLKTLIKQIKYDSGKGKGQRAKVNGTKTRHKKQP